MFKPLGQSALIFRLFIILFLVLLTQVPIALVSNLIQQRSWTQRDALEEVSRSHGGEQLISGPILTIPYIINTVTMTGQVNKTHSNFHIYPDDLKIDSRIVTEKRSRGIFEIPVYTSKVTISGLYKIDTSSLPSTISKDNISWKEAVLSIGITSPKAIKDEVTLLFNNQSFNFEPGLKSDNLFAAGVHASIKNALTAETKNINFNFELSFNGAQSFSVVPVGKITEIQLSSNWKDPSFFGDYLPDFREINNEGFQAHWKITDLGRDIPRIWDERTNDNPNEDKLSLGVNFFSQVDSYDVVKRSVKYELLFIGITFLSFYLFEILCYLKIHPIQYLFIGAGMVLFYLLFLALSEHIPLFIAYTIAGSAAISIVAGYSITILKSYSKTFIVVISLAVQYAFLYAVLNAEDYALLIGSIGLTCTLVISMYLTRNIDWYNLYKKEEIKDNITTINALTN
jgi:inner membrane protein